MPFGVNTAFILQSMVQKTESCAEMDWNMDFIFKVFIRLIVVFTALPLHEYAHGLVAYWLGDYTAKSQGRLDLNPIRHFDLIGTTALLLTGYGWAKPVPINPNNFRNSKVGVKGGIALTALAGPVSNILMAYLCLILYKIGFYWLPDNAFCNILTYAFSFMMSINMGLAVFNLIPSPPLDGSRVLCYFLPNKIVYFLEKYERYIFIGLFVVMYTGILSKPIHFVTNWIYAGLDIASRFIDLLAGAL